jgi:hypothetical protein
LGDIDSVRIQDPLNRTLHALLASTIYWRDLLVGILPPGSDGIVVVFENECNPTFTFQINGPDVDYIGRDDLHDPKYNDMEKSVGIAVTFPMLTEKH